MTKSERNSEIVKKVRAFTDKFDAWLKHDYDVSCAKCDEARLEKITPFEQQLHEI